MHLSQSNLEVLAVIELGYEMTYAEFDVARRLRVAARERLGDLPGGLTRHNPAIGAERNIGQGASAARLQELLGLSDDELCAALAVDPLTLLSGELDHRPELGILLTLIDEAQVQAQAGPQMLSRWVRAAGPEGRPIDALTGRDFAAFEDALGQFAERGFVLRGGRDRAGG
ncbi:MAG TPA: hypothetical protein VHW04_19395 [Solirubrobacteraceae bacterium]|nr:hypothetical protein [Solirubrobacteraceae bacterium]